MCEEMDNFSVTININIHLVVTIYIYLQKTDELVIPNNNL